MGWSIYIRKGKVYIPTSVDTSDGILMDAEPIEVAAIEIASAIRDAIVCVVNRGRRVVPPPSRDAYKNAPILGLAGVKTWSAFYKGTIQLGFMRGETGFEAFSLKPGEHGGYVVDEATRETLPSDWSLTKVADRIAERVQQAADRGI